MNPYADAVTLSGLGAAAVGFGAFLATLQQQATRAGITLYSDDRIKALSMWLDYGFELGNHTFSHASLNRVPLKQWEEEVIRGEALAFPFTCMQHPRSAH